MKTRTWPYGTEKEAVIHDYGGRATIDHRPGKLDPKDAIVVCEDVDGEGHVMVGVDHDIPLSGRMVGQRVVIRFVQGGPTGGYWKIVRRL